MSEQVGGLNAYEQYEENDKFAAERELQGLFETIRQQGTLLSQLRFSTAEQAKDEGVKFAAVVNELTRKVSRSVTFRITGSEIAYSNIDVDLEDGKIIGLGIDTEDPFIMCDPLTELTGHYYGAPLLPGYDERGYFTTPYIILENTRRSKVYSDDKMPVAQLVIQSYAKAPLTTATYIDIPALAEYDARQAAYGRVVMKSIERQQEIRAALEFLEETFAAADETKFLPLENLDALLSLGRITSEDGDTMAVVDALREVFGHGRIVEIKGMAYEGPSGNILDRYQITGKILDILDSHENLQVSEALLVMETPRVDENTGMTEKILYYVPISGIESLKY